MSTPDLFALVAGCGSLISVLIGMAGGWCAGSHKRRALEDELVLADELNEAQAARLDAAGDDSRWLDPWPLGQPHVKVLRDPPVPSSAEVERFCESLAVRTDQFLAVILDRE